MMKKLTMKLRENVKHELSEVERKKETKIWVTKIKKKCKKVKLFNYAFGEGEDDDSDEEGEDMKKIFKEFSKLTIDRLTEIESEKFPKTYDNKKDKIKFINELPKAQKNAMIRAIDYNKPKIYDKNYSKKKGGSPNGERMKKFLLNWFEDVESNECVSKDSILYPHTLDNKIVMLLSKQVELRALSMQNEEDVWFIDTIRDLPKRIYDQMMLAKLLPRSSLRNLEQA